ncbi:MAG: D-aminoacyl-tRNA deacylase [Thermodesulfobacteriota bacterium]|nr:D-aminoacyl-tRNA deacylase [Thermodesulfobacteriota bacterium]
MKTVIQRVRESSVTVDGDVIGKINAGLLVLLGVAGDDDKPDADFLVNKIIHLRIFEDDQGRMNRSLLDVGGEMLVVSQFTLLGDCRKGRRPSFVKAGPPEKADALYQYFIQTIREAGVRVAEGRFGAMMDVSLVNHGPVTLILESRPNS